MVSQHAEAGPDGADRCPQARGAAVAWHAEAFHKPGISGPFTHIRRATWSPSPCHARIDGRWVRLPMPELPDVEGFRRTLRRAAGRTLERVDVLDGGVLRDVSAAELRARLDGAVLATPRRHGKHLVAPLRAPGRRHRSTEPSILFDFGMTGALTWVTDDSARHRHDRVV